MTTSRRSLHWRFGSLPDEHPPRGGYAVSLAGWLRSRSGRRDQARDSCRIWLRQNLSFVIRPLNRCSVILYQVVAPPDFHLSISDETCHMSAGHVTFSTPLIVMV